jgi:hypothetical protein
MCAPSRQPLHMVSASAARQRVVPAQETVDEKDNEIAPFRYCSKDCSSPASLSPSTLCGPDHHTTDADHGRIEERRHVAFHKVDWLLPAWSLGGPNTPASCMAP